MNDELGNRMKSQYEQRTRTYLPRRTYTIIRLDGKCFGNFTKGMNRPYDENFIRAMDATAGYLCEQIQGCQFAYVQSDEISLLLTDFASINTDAWFDGQVQKMVSVSASIATAMFNAMMMQDYFCGVDGKGLSEHWAEGTDVHDVSIQAGDIINYMPYGFPKKKLAFFDSRAFTIPDPVEVENYFICRQKDAIRNSKSMHAQSLYSHKELHGKSQIDMLKMIEDKNEDWNKLPEGFKIGRTMQKHIEGHYVETFLDFIEHRNILTDLIPKIDYEKDE